PTKDPIQPYSGNGDAFVTKFQPDGASLAYSTYVGLGVIMTTANSIAVDPAGNAYLTGFDVPNASGRGFVTKLNAAGRGYVYWIYMDPSTVNGVAVDPAGAAYVTG